MHFVFFQCVKCSVKILILISSYFQSSLCEDDNNQQIYANVDNNLDYSLQHREEIHSLAEKFFSEINPVGDNLIQVVKQGWKFVRNNHSDKVDMLSFDFIEEISKLRNKDETHVNKIFEENAKWNAILPLDIILEENIYKTRKNAADDFNQKEIKAMKNNPPYSVVEGLTWLIAYYKEGLLAMDKIDNLQNLVNTTRLNLQEYATELTSEKSYLKERRIKVMEKRLQDIVGNDTVEDKIFERRREGIKTRVNENVQNLKIDSQTNSWIEIPRKNCTRNLISVGQYIKYHEESRNTDLDEGQFDLLILQELLQLLEKLEKTKNILQWLDWEKEVEMEEMVAEVGKLEEHIIPEFVEKSKPILDTAATALVRLTEVVKKKWTYLTTSTDDIERIHDICDGLEIHNIIAFRQVRTLQDDIAKLRDSSKPKKIGENPETLKMNWLKLEL